ncbi:hypothetical protein ABPG72_007431 [Tetrahymena utriculariae]
MMLSSGQNQANATSTYLKSGQLSRVNSRCISEINILNMSQKTIDSAIREDSQQFQLEQGKKDLTKAAKQFIERQNAIFQYKRNQSLNQEVKLSHISSPSSIQNQDTTNRSSKKLQGFSQFIEQQNFINEQANCISKSSQSDGFYKNKTNLQKDQFIVQYQQISGNGLFNSHNRWNVAQQKKINSIRQGSYDSQESKESTPKNIININRVIKDKSSLCQNNSQKSLLNSSNYKGSQMNQQNQTANSLQRLQYKRQNDQNQIQNRILKAPEILQRNDQQSYSNSQQSALQLKTNQLVCSQSYSINSSNQQVNNYQLIKNSILKRQLKKVGNEMVISTFSNPSTPTSQFSNQKSTPLADNQFRELIKIKIDQKLQNTSDKQNQAEENVKISETAKNNTDNNKYSKTQSKNFTNLYNLQSQQHNYKNQEIQLSQQKSLENVRGLKQPKDFLLKNNSFQITKQNENSSTEFLYQKTYSSFVNKQNSQSKKVDFYNSQLDGKGKNQMGIGTLNINFPQKASLNKSVQKESKKQNIMITPQQIQQIMESERRQQHIQRQNIIYELVKQVEENPLDRLQVLKAQESQKSKRRSTKKQSIPFIYDIIKSKNQQAVAVIQDILRTNNMIQLSEEIESAIQQNALEQFDKEKPKHQFQKHNTMQQFYQQIQNDSQLNTIKQMKFQDFANEYANKNTSYYNDTLSSKNKNVSQIQAISENKFVNQISKDQIFQKKKVKILRQQLKEALKYLFKLKITPSEISSYQVFSTKPYQKKGSYELISYSKKGDTDLVRDLTMENKYLVYDFDYVYMTALHWACKRGHCQVAGMLIQQGADVDAKDLIGRTPLYFAISIQDAPIVELLLSNQASPWSTKEYNLNEMVKENSKLTALLSRYRKLDIVARMKKKTLQEEPQRNQSQSAEGAV